MKSTLLGKALTEKLEINRDDFVKHHINTINLDGSWESSSDEIKNVIIKSAEKYYDNLRLELNEMNIILTDVNKLKNKSIVSSEVFARLKVHRKKFPRVIKGNISLVRKWKEEFDAIWEALK